MSVSETMEYVALSDAGAESISKHFASDMTELFKESPEIFEGRSTKDEWDSQVENAKTWLEDAIAFEVLKLVEQAECRLHDGGFLDASVACRKAGLVV